MLAVFVPVAFISGDLGAVLPAVRADDRRLDGPLGLQLPDAQPGALRPPAQAARRRARRAPSPTSALPRLAYVIFFGLLAYAVRGRRRSSTRRGLEGSECGLSRLGAAAPSAGVAGWFAGAVLDRLIAAFFAGFNRVFDAATAVYGRLVGGLIRVSAVVLVVYAGLLGLTCVGLPGRPGRLHPERRTRGTSSSTPSSPTPPRSTGPRRSSRRLSEVVRETPGVAHTIDLAGYSVLNAHERLERRLAVRRSSTRSRSAPAGPSSGADAVLRSLRREDRRRSRRRSSASSAPRRSTASAASAASS